MRQAVRLLAKHLARFLPLAPGATPVVWAPPLLCLAGGSLNQMQTERIGRQDAPVENHAFEKQCIPIGDLSWRVSISAGCSQKPLSSDVRLPIRSSNSTQGTTEELRVRFRERPFPMANECLIHRGHRGRSSTCHRTIYPWFKPLNNWSVPRGQGTKTVLMLESKARVLMAWRTFHYPCTARRTIVHVSPWTRGKPVSENVADLNPPRRIGCRNKQ